MSQNIYTDDSSTIIDFHFMILILLSFPACLWTQRIINTLTKIILLSVCPSVTETPLPLRIAPIDHQTYQPLSLLTIEPINHK